MCPELHTRRRTRAGPVPAGLVVGHFSDLRDNAIPFGVTAEEIIDRYARMYDFPVAYGFPVGHEPDNLALVVGQAVTLTVDEASGRLTA
jgi:muramoyltetrapeptide carboxypeptidase